MSFLCMQVRCFFKNIYIYIFLLYQHSCDKKKKKTFLDIIMQERLQSDKLSQSCYSYHPWCGQCHGSLEVKPRLSFSSGQRIGYLWTAPSLENGVHGSLKVRNSELRCLRVWGGGTWRNPVRCRDNNWSQAQVPTCNSTNQSECSLLPKNQKRKNAAKFIEGFTFCCLLLAFRWCMIHDSLKYALKDMFEVALWYSWQAGFLPHAAHTRDGKCIVFNLELRSQQ